MISIGWPERLARAVEERALAPRLAQRVGADHAHALGLHVAQPLAEALEALQRAGDGLAVQAALLVEAGREPHHLAQAVDDHQLAVRVARDHHVEAVGPEVDSREDVGQRVGRLGQPAQAEKEEPQPQVVVAFGLRITNCAPSRSSL